MLKFVGPLIICFQYVHLACSQGGRGMSGVGRGGMGGAGGNRNLRLPPGFANLRGEVVDIRNKLIQRINQRGTNYYSFDSQEGPPVFQRYEKDSGKQFIVFPDINYPNGDGHFIILRRMFGAMMPGSIPQPIYEAFQMSLGDSISGLVMNFDREKYMQNRHNTMMGVGGYGGNANIGSRSGSSGGSYPRLKRRDSFSGEAGEIQLTPVLNFANVTHASPAEAKPDHNNDPDQDEGEDANRNRIMEVKLASN